VEQLGLSLHLRAIVRCLQHAVFDAQINIAARQINIIESLDDK